MKKLGFIGVGNMGGAILKGIEGKLGNTAVFAYDANAEKLADLRLVGATAAGSAREIAEKCDFILLAVKPQHLGEVLAEKTPLSRKPCSFPSARVFPQSSSGSVLSRTQR